MKEYPFKDLKELNNAEVEGGETLQLPNGDMYQLTGDKHHKGGIDVMLPEGTRVFSQYLKLGREEVKEISGIDKAKSPAYLSKKYDTTPFKDILLDKSSRTDDIRYNTAQLMASKYSAMQDVVFNAQENHKDFNKKGKFKYGGQKLPKYQVGNQVPFTGMDVQVPDSGLRVPGFPIQPTQFNDAYTTTGVSYPHPTDSRLIVSNFNPAANNPFFTEGTYKKRGQLEGRDQENLINYQTALSYPKQSFGLNDRTTAQVNEQYAFHLRDVMSANPDQNLRAEIIDPKTRQRIPVTQATDEQIRASNGELHLKNLRTGKNDLVDGLNGNFGEGTTNQGFYPHVRTTFKDPHIIDTPLDRLPQIDFTPNKPYELPNKNNVESPVGTYDDRPYPFEEEVPVGINPEQLLSGVRAGLDIAALATLRRGVPNYQFTPTQTATTRFDPINQLSQDRGFNAAKEALDNSNLPEQAKQAQLNQIYSNTIQGRNQVDLTNFQGDQATDNANIERTVGTINQNNLNRTASNQAYLQELSRARYTEQAQKQVYIDNLLENYRVRQENKTNLGLLNQLSRNFDFSTQNQQVNYTPGQGYNPDYNNLQGYNSQNAEGTKVDELQKQINALANIIRNNK